MATHSSILAWKIPWTEEPGRLQHGVTGVEHDLATELSRTSFSHPWDPHLPWHLNTKLIFLPLQTTPFQYPNSITCPKCSTWVQSQKRQTDLCLFPRQTILYAPTRNAEEAEVEQFYEDLQDLLELTCKKDVLFIIGDWNAKVGS